ncbi:MPND protein, partial [Chauna torquata]|nr:MPND protein [Chauna torquata]
KAAGGSRGAVLTRRGITLRVLLRDGLLEPARGVLSIYYLGKKFVGDLGADGTITWQETGQVFNSPSAWATHCKRLVNPAKKSGCGWASVRYKGQKLDQYKAAWLRKHQPNAPAAEEVGGGSGPRGALGCPRAPLGPASSPRGVGRCFAPRTPQSLASEGEEDELPEEEEEEAREGRVPVPEPAAGKRPEERSKKQQCRSLAEQAGAGEEGQGPGGPGTLAAMTGRSVLADHGPPGKRPENKPRVPVRYCTLGTRDSARNPQTLVEVTSFAAINKFQPFNVAISSNVLLLLVRPHHEVLRAPGGIRCEGVVSLGGRWDTNTQRRRRGGGAGGPQPAAEPPTRASPAVLTVLRAFPCRSRLGDAEAAAPSLLPGPYYHGNPGVESKIAPFWVMPPPEQRPNDYGIPMDVEVAYIQDGFLTNDVLQEMTLLVEFYKGAPDLVKFQELWSQDQTYLDKLKGSLASRTPKDQSFTHILEQIYSLLKHSS